MCADIVKVTTASLDVTPDQLERSIQREDSLRQVIIRYIKSKLVEDVHFRYFDKSRKEAKPSLLKAGALNLRDLFRCQSVPGETETLYDEERHMIVVATMHLVNSSGQIVATGKGVCATRENKYKSQGKPPENFYNTVYKMAHKRALVDAATQLPLVSELFTQDSPGEPEDEEETAPIRGGGMRHISEVKAPAPSAEAQQPRVIDSPSDIEITSPYDQEKILTNAMGLLVEKKIFKDKKEAWLWFKARFGVDSIKQCTGNRFEETRQVLREKWSERPAMPSDVAEFWRKLEMAVKLGAYTSTHDAAGDVAEGWDKPIDTLNFNEIRKSIAMLEDIIKKRKEQAEDDTRDNI